MEQSFASCNPLGGCSSSSSGVIVVNCEMRRRRKGILKNKIREEARAEASEEATRNEEHLRRTTGKLRKFKIATVISGVMLLCDLILAVQFMVGGRWHEYWDGAGRLVMSLAGILFPIFGWIALMTYSLWRYLRDISDIYKQYSPPLSKHRTGTRHDYAGSTRSDESEGGGPD